MNGFTQNIFEEYIKNVLHITKPNFVNKQEYKCDYAIELDGKIIFLEHETSADTAIKSSLHILAHLIYMVILNSEDKIISKESEIGNQILRNL